MLPLLDTLRRQHDELAVLVKQIEEALVAGDTDRIARELTAFRVALMAHLEVEDRRLYPALSSAAAATQLKVPIQVVEIYQRNMAGVGVALRSFFEVYSGEIRDVESVRRDWTMISQLLAQRIESEESTLYPLYRSLVDGDA